ncbi:MAG: LptA/OstA family protein [Armatimonadota bacterium]
MIQKLTQPTIKLRALITVVGTAAIILLAAVIIYAQADAKKAAPKYTEVRYSADATSYRWEGDDRILVLSGNVKFVQGDTVLVADKVDYRESTRTASAAGKLRIYDDLNSITGDKCTVFFKDKKGTITGSVHMIAKPKPKADEDADSKSLKSQIKDETNLDCSAIDYFYKEKRAVLSSPVKVVQKDRTVTADNAVYLGNDEIIELAGNVKGNDEKDKHNFTSPKVRISLKDTDQWIEAEKATGTFYIKDDEEEPVPAEKTSDKPAEKPAPTPDTTQGKQ